jgi:signal-transduction protein with cAMP-binding, CBS, and nucleotidyltransferase domain
MLGRGLGPRGPLLRSVPILTALPSIQLQLVAAKMTERVHPPGSEIVRLDDPLSALHVVASGSVQESVPGGGGRPVVNTYGPSYSFGSQAVLSSAAIHATFMLTATTEVTVLTCGCVLLCSSCCRLRPNSLLCAVRSCLDAGLRVRTSCQL